LATEVKPRSNRILLIFGVFLAALAFAGALLLGRTPGGSGITGGARNVQIVIATKDIAPAQQITTDMVDVQNFSTEQAPPFAYRTRDAVVGHFAAVQIRLGQPILQDVLVSTAGDVPAPKQDYLKIPAGMVAMQIPAGELVGAGGFIQPDDRIDIIVTLGSTTKTAFTGLRVLRVGPAGSPNARGITSSYTVIVTLKQAEDLKFLIDQTNYKYVLKSISDYGNIDGDTGAGTDLNSFKRDYHLH
jgi:Flp pilus assembly protein CpaB